MRHRMRGRKLGRNSSHRKAMFRNMACSLIRTVRADDEDKQKPRVAGRIVTTLPKAKELRPMVEKLITLARRAIEHEENARQFSTSADRNSEEWKNWRESDQWNEWNQAIAPAVALRRRAFAILRDHLAVKILFDELASRFENRQGGYTRVIRLSKIRLGDAGRQALIEFVGERDRVRSKPKAPVVAGTDELLDEGSETQEAVADQSSNAEKESQEPQGRADQPGEIAEQETDNADQDEGS